MFVRLYSLVILMLLTGSGTGSFAQTLNLMWFFPHVDTVIRYPNAQYNLTIMCQKKIEKQYVSFVGAKGTNRVLLAAVTPKPLTDVTKSISLIVDFADRKPSPGKVSTWGYVFDRNHDGKIDYMALVAGAGPVKADDVPENFPKRGQQLSRSNLEIFVSHCSLVFDHWADDNFDDTLDATIHHDMDPISDWVQRQIVVRSTKFDGKFDSVSTFRAQPGDLEGDTVSYRPDRVPYNPIGMSAPDAITRESFLKKTEILHLFNRAAKMCGLTSSNFYPLPPEE